MSNLPILAFDGYTSDEYDKFAGRRILSGFDTSMSKTKSEQEKLFNTAITVRGMNFRTNTGSVIRLGEYLQLQTGPDPAGALDFIYVSLSINKVGASPKLPTDMKFEYFGSQKPSIENPSDIPYLGAEFIWGKYTFIDQKGIRYTDSTYINGKEQYIYIKNINIPNFDNFYITTPNESGNYILQMNIWNIYTSASAAGIFQSVNTHVEVSTQFTVSKKEGGLLEVISTIAEFFTGTIDTLADWGEDLPRDKVRIQALERLGTMSKGLGAFGNIVNIERRIEEIKKSSDPMRALYIEASDMMIQAGVGLLTDAALGAAARSAMTGVGAWVSIIAITTAAAGLLAGMAYDEYLSPIIKKEIGRYYDTLHFSGTITKDKLIQYPEVDAKNPIYNQTYNNMVGEIRGLVGYDRSIQTLAGLNPLQYIASNPDTVKAFGTNQVEAMSYIMAHPYDGHSWSTFDPYRYTAGYADLTAALGLNADAATQHYITRGFSENRASDSFSPYRYVASYADLIPTIGADATAAAKHFIAYGRAEGRSDAGFNAYNYLASYDDLAKAFGSDTESAAKHFITNGRNEGRVATLFNASAYLNANADLRAALGNNQDAATKHYVEFGRLEERSSFTQTSLKTIANTNSLGAAASLAIAI